MYSPKRLLAILIISVFAAELLIMSVLSLFEPIPEWVENSLDAFLLVVLVSPMLYFWVFRPLKMLNAELEARTRDAESANRAKSAFMANISHEIRTPLHVLIGLGQLLRRDPDHPVQLQRLDQLCATSDHLLALVNDILDLSKIESGRFVLDDSAFILGSVIDQVREVVTQLAFVKKLALKIDISPACFNAVVRGDALRLSQILINLGGNAVKFSNHGKIQIGVSILEENAATLRLCFSVLDSGIGIAKEDQTRIFLPFEQIDGSITREYGGTGLGLAICHRLVSMMGGRIWVDSQPGVGSTFSFELTLARGDKVPETASVMPTAPDLVGLRVLVAEDHPLSQEIILEMLEDLGCIAEIATDGVEAVECALVHDFDLILMDMQMPKMDGLAATRIIRTLPGHRDKPIIALTANAFVEDRQRCQDAGMNDHISKPVTPAKLASILSKWLPDLVVPSEQGAQCECELSEALAKISGLEVAISWWRSPERLADYCALLIKFVKLHGQDISLLREHLAAGEFYAAHAIAHNLKGIAGLIGARRVESLADEMVQALRSGSDNVDIAKMEGACEAELARLRVAIRALPIAEESFAK
ncbi:autoinducer 2 sensor kinase/phosphatase LuxQ [mine drainage metagenome]|uniref:Autoinducer 2 sensor kinase/phosphatase LuxQ n=1 Tax=mine drainage metagenome TaxID=410659 RepID=A0A1J5TJI6_9ZZZZ